MGEWLDAVSDFADRHVRVFAIAIAVLAVPLSLAYLAPVALQVVARPLDETPSMGIRPATFTFLDADGQVIGRKGPVAGEVLRLEDMPAYLPAAFLAMEDRRFYAHHGVDFLGLARAAYLDLRAHRVVAGGSSISQQTAKLLYDRRDRTFRSKLRELVRTAAVEKSFSKRHILELYLNRIYLGGGAYGVDTAARTYFGVSARNVSLSQAAMLAALTRAPSVFSPRRDLAAAQARAANVLAAMADMGEIRTDQAADAAAHPATIVARPTETHSYFLDAAAEEVKELAGESGPGELIVHTTLRSDLQAQADHIAANAAAGAGHKLGFSQVAMVAMKPDGAVAAMVGGVSYARSVFNRVMQAHRQPGSAFKPFVYLAALEAGISPWDWRDDRPVDIAGYQPANYKDAHYGRLRLTDALARSVNTITVNLAQEVGIAKVAAAAQRLGITSPLQNNASLALGTNEVTPLELTAAYAAFANGGERVQPYLVSRIERRDGRLVYARTDTQAEKVIADNVRRDLNAMLFNVVTSGTGTAARLPGREAAGKTGTTQDYRDAWFVGFTTDYVASVWVGNDNNRPMRKVTGGLIPAELWKELMSAAEAGQAPRPLDRSPEPAGVTDPFATEQVSYVDEMDSVAPQLPVDQKGDYIASGSGVTSAPGRIARAEPPAPPDPPLASYQPRPVMQAPAMQTPVTQPVVQAPVQPPVAQAYTAPQPAPPQQDYQPRQPAPTSYGYRPYAYIPRQPPQPPDRPSQDVRQMPYQAYVERRETERDYDPPANYSYYPAPRAYYPAPRSYSEPRYGAPDGYSRAPDDDGFATR